MSHGKLLNTLILAALAVPGIAMAADVAPASPHTFTSNVGLVSDYLYRGISQTGGKPAIQGGFDYAHSSGFYAGVWGSSISWISDGGLASNAGLELDTYLGFKNSFADDFSYDVGFLRYNYPTGSYVNPIPANFAKADTNEVYGALGYKWLTAKYSYSLGDTFAVSQAKGTSYLELNASYPIADTGITLGAHCGKQTYKGISTANLVAASADPTYSDYKLSASKDFSGFVLGLAYSKTNASTLPGAYYKILNKDLGKGTVVLSLTRAF
ncbi:MAG: hypothetical protein A2342_10215 [Gallionellales bacterium RIFOXYB12_FULL_54_9]|nr:MAG: hypothetical protein A2342_10215 [Gallionellales bacterium RIFOXYB12_FULL_54_9]